MGRRHIFAIILGMVLGAQIVEAKEFPVQARLFAGNTKVDPKNLNTELEAQSLKKVDSISYLGVEATYPVLSFVNVGLRYSRRSAENYENPSNPTTDYYSRIDQDSVLGLIRIPFLKTALLRLDAYAGVGGSNTTFKIKSATPQDGELSKKESGDWFATPYYAYGASVAIGWKMVYLVVEGGMETNVVDGFKRTGTINNNIQKIDLSGSYFMLALMFDGVMAKSR